MNLALMLGSCERWIMNDVESFHNTEKIIPERINGDRQTRRRHRMQVLLKISLVRIFKDEIHGVAIYEAGMIAWYQVLNIFKLPQQFESCYFILVKRLRLLAMKNFKRVGLVVRMGF